MTGWPWICLTSTSPRTWSDRKASLWDKADLHSREKKKILQTMRWFYKLLWEVSPINSTLILLAKPNHMTKSSSRRKKMHNPPTGRDTTRKGARIYDTQSYNAPQ